MINVLMGSVFAWPLFALCCHLLLPNQTAYIRQCCQTVFIVGWLIIVALLFGLCVKPVLVTMGSWPSPFGIAFVSDKLSNVMLLVFGIVALCINFYSYFDTGILQKEKAFYAGFWLLLIGASGAVLTSDLFNLYVWFEVILVSAFVLLAANSSTKPRAIMHYALMNITGTLLMLLSIALLYGFFGALNYAQIAESIQTMHRSDIAPVLGLMLFAIGLKGAVFPLYFWLPKAYPKTSSSSTMLLSSLVTKVVMVIFLRLIWLWPPLHTPFFMDSLVVIAALTMFTGVMGAASQFRLKDILAFHIVSQLGYILLAIVQPLAVGVVAAVYFLIHNIFVKTNLFMISGIIEQQTGTSDLKQLGNLLKSHRYLSIIFFLSAMSLAGFPPFSGFWAKFLVIKGALISHYWLSSAIAIFVSLLTLYSMIKIWRFVFCQVSCRYPRHFQQLPFSLSLYCAILPTLIIPLVMGVCPDFFLVQLHQVLDQISHPDLYIHLVLGVAK